MQNREDVIKRIFSLTGKGIKYDLDRISKAVERLGNPQNAYKSIHVAGTNGKGSTCAYCDAMLRASGLKTGLYTSPHIIDFEERYIVDGRPVATDEWLDVFTVIDPLIHDLDLTFFEIGTLLAFELFKRRGVEWAVFETGMGGRFDATNVVVPTVSVITAIDMDHMEYLGPDLVSIAREKLGIVKNGVPVVMHRPATPAVGSLSRDTCAGLGALLTFVDESNVDAVRMADGTASFEYEGSHFTLPLPGRHQIVNAIGAIKACEIAGVGNRASRKSGIESTVLPGRFQVVQSGGRSVIFDVGHNPGAARVLARAIRERFKEIKPVLVIGMMKDKDIAGVLKHLVPVVSRIIFTRPDIDRACGAEDLPGFLPKYASVPFVVVPDVGNAVKEAMGSGQGPVCVAGSFYTVSEGMVAVNIRPYG